MIMSNSKAFFAELIGTFTLVLIGAGLAAGGDALKAAFGFGFVVAAFAYAYGHISAQFNPAVTLGMAINNMLSWNQAFYNWIAQLIGATLAAALLNNWGFNGATTLGAGVGTIEGLVAELLLTFFLVSTVLQTARNNFGGLASGFALFFGVLFGFSLTGGSLNFARSFGPAVFTGGLSDTNFWVVYFAGPMLGGLVAAWIHRYFASDEDAVIPAAPSRRSSSRRK
jgi:aquaporin Z